LGLATLASATILATLALGTDALALVGILALETGALTLGILALETGALALGIFALETDALALEILALETGALASGILVTARMVFAEVDIKQYL